MMRRRVWSRVETSRRRWNGRSRWHTSTVPRGRQSERSSPSKYGIGKFRRPSSHGHSISETQRDEEDFPTMRFMPHTDDDVRAMLDAIGAGSIEDLIAYVPANLRSTAGVALAPGLSEQDVAAEITALANQNRAADFISFLGGGYYNHYVPAVVRAVTSRAEFATSYTPYQAEASQGTTQAIFEFQTLITQLTGLEVANASMYDGASAAAEAVLMAHRIVPRRSVVALSRALWPDYRATIRTYLSALKEIDIIELPFDASGQIDLAALQNVANANLLCVVAGYPNAFGIV